MHECDRRPHPCVSGPSRRAGDFAAGRGGEPADRDGGHGRGTDRVNGQGRRRAVVASLDRDPARPVRRDFGVVVFGRVGAHRAAGVGASDRSGGGRARARNSRARPARHEVSPLLPGVRDRRAAHGRDLGGGRGARDDYSVSRGVRSGVSANPLRRARAHPARQRALPSPENHRRAFGRMV